MSHRVANLTLAIADPGLVGLESEIRLTGTRDLWEQARLLVSLPREFTWAARHRRRLVIAELARRLVVRP